MPDKNDNETAEADDLPQTSLHAHADGREEDVVGDSEPEVREEGDLDGADEGPPGNPVSEKAERDAT